MTSSSPWEHSLPGAAPLPEMEAAPVQHLAGLRLCFPASSRTLGTELVLFKPGPRGSCCHHLPQLRGSPPEGWNWLSFSSIPPGLGTQPHPAKGSTPLSYAIDKALTPKIK